MLKKWTIILGIIIILVGLLGFVSNPIVGANGYFMTGHALNAIYLIIGILLLIGASMGEMTAALWLKVFGVVYILLAIDGFFQTQLLGFIASNSADVWLHLVLGIVLLIVGMKKPKMNSAPSMDQMAM